MKRGRVMKREKELERLRARKEKRVVEAMAYAGFDCFLEEFFREATKQEVEDIKKKQLF